MSPPAVDRQTHTAEKHTLQHKKLNIFAYKTTTIMINDAVNVLNEARAPVCVKDVCNVTYV